ncbi:MAG TPA: hypothetical protein DCY13_18565, partial [Verrucomicrobiales bacterium]|nr:hypothetical protein [Verrucomicrobiales bacterium]
RLLDLLQVVTGRKKNPSSLSASDEFDRVLGRAARHFVAGEVQPCAQACAQLTELRPDAWETLLLVGLSLRNWASPNDARTAFRCLVQRQHERLHEEAVTEAESARQQPAEGGNLATLLAGVLCEPQIPAEALTATLDFVTAMAQATDPAALLASRRDAQTPLLFALLGLPEELLAGCVEPAVQEQIARVRERLHRPANAPAPGARQRRSGYSFCIITAGQRPEKLARQVASIHALQLPAYEILVGGEVAQVPEGVTAVDLADAAQAGRLGRMRNELGRRAAFDHLVVCDDDLVFEPDFLEGLQRFGEGYDAMAVRIVNPDGSRFWDWATTGGPKGSVLLDYWDTDPNIYITGGFCVLKAAVFDHVQWDELRGFYEREDVDFSTRLKVAGFTIRYNPFCTVLHDDDRYTRAGRRIYRFEHLREAILQAHRAGEMDRVRQLFSRARIVAGSYPDRKEDLRTIAHQMKLPELLEGLNPPTAKVEATAPAAPQAIARSTGKLELNWLGAFLDYGSLANINRVLTDELVIAHGATVRRVQTLPVNGKLPKALQSYRGKLAGRPSETAALTVRHAWPPDWTRPTKGQLAVIQPWEFGALPREWVQAAQQVDAFWVPSNYVRRVYVESGVPAGKVHVLPNGIDPELFRSDARPAKLATRKKFKFLFVGGTIHRKGPDVLLKAFCETFTRQDDVCLVIKDFGGGTVYAGQTIEAQIRQLQQQPNAPEILLLNEELPAHEIPGVYTACDCLVHPYRGEGFGLPVLEAMACGLPVIVTAGGSTDDFVPAEAGYHIPSTRKVFGQEISGMPLAGDGWLLEPDLEATKRLLRHVFTHADEARAKGQSAAAHVRERWTWKQTANRLVELAHQLMLDTASVTAADQGKAPGAALQTPSPATSNGPATKKTGAIKLPPVAMLGHLGAARELLRRKKHVAAWNAALTTIANRPFHPEAYLFMAEIALQLGEAKLMQECVDRALALAPEWKAAKEFLRAHPVGKVSGGGRLAPLPPQELRLSVCLITRNEERFIGQCLDSVRDIAHQIVVLDTGSTDRTVAIAKQRGAEVHHFTWCDDFSAARNAALEHAKGDWVLVVDADEVLPAEAAIHLRRALTAHNTIGFRLPIVDIGREDEGCTYVPRLFRNAPGLFYLSRVHEQVFSSVEARRQEWGMEFGVGTATLIHHGYTAEMVRDRNKVVRNLRLLELAIE